MEKWAKNQNYRKEIREPETFSKWSKPDIPCETKLTSMPPISSTPPVRLVSV